MRATDRTTVSYHEAGHAVMAALSPYHVPGVAVVRVEQREFTVSEGCCAYATIQHNDLWSWRIAAGGGAGERILRPKADVFGYGVDFANPTAARLDLILCGANLLDTDDHADPMVAINREKRELAHVCRMVRQHTSAVHEIAGILLAQGQIEGATVRAIVGPALQLAKRRLASVSPPDPRQLSMFGEVAQ